MLLIVFNLELQYTPQFLSNCYRVLKKARVLQFGALEAYVCIAWRSADLIHSGCGQ